jgi:hypothetical protein
VDEPLQKRLQQLSGVGPAVRDEAVTADKEATAKRAAEEATVKRVVEETMAKKAAEERASEEAVVKAAASEAIGAAGGSPAPSQVPPATRAKRSVTLSGSTQPAKCPYRGVWKPRFVQLSTPFFFLFSFSYYLFVHVHFLQRGCDDGRRCGCQGGSGAGSYQRAPDPRRSP